MRKTTGLSLLLLIFLSLCLITFSLLSVSEASADRNLSRKSADRTDEYYAAVTAANEILSEIDSVLAGYLLQASTAEDPSKTYIALCADLPEAMTEDAPSIVWTPETGTIHTTSAESDSGTLSFAVPVTDGQLLQAELLITWPQKASDPLYQVSVWKVVNTRDWNPDTSQRLYRTETE